MSACERLLTGPPDNTVRGRIPNDFFGMLISRACGKLAAELWRRFVPGTGIRPDPVVPEYCPGSSDLMEFRTQVDNDVIYKAKLLCRYVLPCGFFRLLNSKVRIFFSPVLTKYYLYYKIPDDLLET